MIMRRLSTWRIELKKTRKHVFAGFDPLLSPFIALGTNSDRRSNPVLGSLAKNPGDGTLQFLHNRAR